MLRALADAVGRECIGPALLAVGQAVPREFRREILAHETPDGKDQKKNSVALQNAKRRINPSALQVPLVSLEAKWRARKTKAARAGLKEAGVYSDGMGKAFSAYNRTHQLSNPGSYRVEQRGPTLVLVHPPVARATIVPYLRDLGYDLFRMPIALSGKPVVEFFQGVFLSLWRRTKKARGFA